MSKKPLFIGAIASIIAINSVVADTTVTSKTYVDNKDQALYDELYKTKQNKIPATGTNANTPGSTVVTYTGTAGNIGERGIYDGSNEYDSSTDADKLVTASVVQNVSNNLPILTSTNRVCAEWVANAAHTDANCLLWNLVNQEVYGRCYSNADCGNGCVCNLDKGICECG